SGILAAVAQDGITPRRIRWRGRPRPSVYKYARRNNKHAAPATYVWHLETLSFRAGADNPRCSKPDNSLNPVL
ncbi:MAG: hypothetical protein ACREDH_07590, partial [Methylocella sp.]